MLTYLSYLPAYCNESELAELHANEEERDVRRVEYKV